MNKIYGIAFAVLLIGSVLAAGFASAQVNPESVTKVGYPPKVIWHQKAIDPTAASTAGKVNAVSVRPIRPGADTFVEAAQARNNKLTPALTNIAGNDESLVEHCEADVNTDGTIDTRDIIAYLNGGYTGDSVSGFWDFLDMWKEQRAGNC